MHVSFVILHYLTLKDTVECVESILNNVEYENYSIIIVDNGSPNGSGSELIKKYNENESIKVIINEENLGFAKGNNIGFMYAKNKLQTDFIVMINNDVIIKDEKFCAKIIEAFKKNDFDICGPDIISLCDNKHQNPERKFLTNLKKTKKRTIKLRMLLILNYIRIDNFLLFIKNKNFSKITNEKKLTICDKDIKLHGSCLIFSRNYIENYDGLFDKTFMYMEEDILSFIADRDNLKVVYYPNLLIYHKEDSATNASLNKNYMKRRFYYKNSLYSCIQLQKLMMTNI